MLVQPKIIVQPMTQYCVIMLDRYAEFAMIHVPWQNFYDNTDHLFFYTGSTQQWLRQKKFTASSSSGGNSCGWQLFETFQCIIKYHWINYPIWKLAFPSMYALAEEKKISLQTFQIYFQHTMHSWAPFDSGNKTLHCAHVDSVLYSAD